MSSPEQDTRLIDALEKFLEREKALVLWDSDVHLKFPGNSSLLGLAISKGRSLRDALRNLAGELQ